MEKSKLYTGVSVQCTQRGENSKKESKENAWKKSHHCEMKNAFDGLINRMSRAKEDSVTFEDRSIGH